MARAASEQSRLFSLPQELQDVIFELAFPPKRNAKYCTKTYWNSREWHQYNMDSHYTRRPFPPPEISNMIVSRRFFVQATQAWCRNQTFSAHHPFPSPSGVVDWTAPGLLGNAWEDLALGTLKGVVPAFVRAMTIESSALYGVHLLPNLRSLRMVVRTEVFRVLGSEAMAWQRVLTCADLQKVAEQQEECPWMGKRFSKLSLTRLREFELLPGCCSYAKTDEDKVLWVSNVKALETVLQPLALSGQGRRSLEGPRDFKLVPALYQGSEVRWRRLGRYESMVIESLEAAWRFWR